MTRNHKSITTKMINTDNIYTGFPDLDWKTGGFERGRLIILGGRPGSGKTMFTISCICNLINSGISNILFFSIDEDKKSLFTRLTKSFAKTDIDGPSDLGIDHENIKKARHILSRCGIKIFDDSEKKVRPKSVKRSCKKYIKDHKTIDLLIVSTLELMCTKSDNKEKTAKILRYLKKLAKKYDCCVLLLTNIKGAIEKREDTSPRLSDFKYKRTITTYSDRVWALQTPEYLENN